jgi:putative heme-binding domain-containing protein
MPVVRHLHARVAMKKTIVVTTAGVAAALLVALSFPLEARQHSYSPEQIAEGRQLYGANCGRCHGDNGDSITGVALFTQIRRASSDDEIAALIRQGLPGTSMPAHSFTTSQSQSVVAFLRSMVGVAPGAATIPATGYRSSVDITRGNAARGKSMFVGKAGCAACHRAEGAGGVSGPDLSAIAAARPLFGFGPLTSIDVATLERAVVEPDADIAMPFRTFQVTLASGAVVRGQLLNQDTFSVQMLDGEQNLRSFPKSELKAFGLLPSPMPSYRERLTVQELTDVLAYLLTLKG